MKPRPEHNTLIELSDVSFSYDAREVLSCVNLAVHARDYLSVIGPNGAGKTTLVKLIVGLLSPTKGSINLFGVPKSSLKERSRIGYVPQQLGVSGSDFPLTVEEVVLIGRAAKRGLLRNYSMTDRDAAKTALERVGMWDIRNRLIGDLSGGQRQRVFIARALAAEPSVLILDEPTAGIDRKAQRSFYDLLRTLNNDEGLTIVLVSHDLSLVAREAAQIAYVNKAVSYYASADDYFSHEGMHRHDQHDHYDH